MTTPGPDRTSIGCQLFDMPKSSFQKYIHRTYTPLSYIYACC
jgi:hypothetical protein